ncbi:MAG: hypothetical protein ABSF09_02080 [Candidatus Bathyarchaeia archaeon]
MSKSHVVYAVSESCPFDALLVKGMKRSVDALLQLNLKRFRVPQKVMSKYSALDVMKQSLELMFEFSPSEKNYREAMRTIQVYSEGDEEMAQTLRASFRFITNAVYNAYAGQRRVETLVPDILFLQGVAFDSTDFQQAFRFVGVRPPEIPTTVKQTIFLDEGFEPYKSLLEGKIVQGANRGREEYWAKRIETSLSGEKGKALMLVGSEHLRSGIIHRLVPRDTGRITRLLRRRGIEVEVVEVVADVNEVFGK